MKKWKCKINIGIVRIHFWFLRSVFWRLKLKLVSILLNSCFKRYLIIDFNCYLYKRVNSCAFHFLVKNSLGKIVYVDFVTQRSISSYSLIQSC